MHDSRWENINHGFFIGAVTNSLILALMFTVRPTGWGFVALFGVFYLLWEMTFTMNDIAYWSMLPSLSRDEKTRNQLTTFVALAASIGAFAVGGLLPTIYPGNASVVFFSLLVSLLPLSSSSRNSYWFSLVKKRHVKIWMKKKHRLKPPNVYHHLQQ